MLNGTCLVFSGDEKKRGQQFLSFGYSRMVLLSFMPSAREFAHLALVRSMRKSERDAIRKCRRRNLGIGVPYPLGTPHGDDDGFSTRDATDTAAARLLLASLSHAVPLYEALEDLPQRERDSALYLPLLFKQARRGDAAAAAAAPQPSLGAGDAFLSTVRALTAAPEATIGSGVSTLFSERCVCLTRFETTGARTICLPTALGLSRDGGASSEQCMRQSNGLDDRR